MKRSRPCSGEASHTAWRGTIKRVIHRYLEHRSRRRALRRGSAENNLAAPYEGRRWCDATERVLIGDIGNRNPATRTSCRSAMPWTCGHAGRSPKQRSP